ncbi:MAG: hypothetical protein FJ297_09680 [Planctomycetes bacterium]|nr:hypothetical protein [Planctomycetota bacterium]
MAGLPTFGSARAEGWPGDGGPESTAPCEADGCGVSAWTVGFDIVFAKPYFEGNPAFTTLESDGLSFNSISDRSFDYDFELSPRIWAHYETGEGIGARAAYWHFDQSAGSLTASPPANGFGSVAPPAFGPSNISGAGVDISSSIPGDTLTASSGLDAYTLDFEVTKRGDFGAWSLLASGGLRYARVGQNYEGTLRNAAATILGVVDYQHANQGIGPTVAIESRRWLGDAITLVAESRASLLMGDGDSRLYAGEDLDLTTPFHTFQTSSRDDLLPILEGRLGATWTSADLECGRFFARGAFEGQWWGGAGSASGEAGDLGFLGFTAGVGLVR